MMTSTSLVGLRAHPRLDLVGDVRDDLHGVAEVLAAALLGDDLRVHAAGRHVGRTDEVHVKEALVVADVEVGLGAVLGHEDLTVLERVHGAGIDVEVRIQLLHRHPQATGAKKSTEAAGRQTLTEGGGNTPGDEDVPGRGFRPPGESMRALCHGIPDYPTDGEFPPCTRLVSQDTSGDRAWAPATRRLPRRGSRSTCSRAYLGAHGTPRSIVSQPRPDDDRRDDRTARGGTERGHHVVARRPTATASDTQRPASAPNVPAPATTRRAREPGEPRDRQHDRARRPRPGRRRSCRACSPPPIHRLPVAAGRPVSADEATTTRPSPQPASWPQAARPRSSA